MLYYFGWNPGNCAAWFSYVFDYHSSCCYLYIISYFYITDYFCSDSYHHIVSKRRGDMLSRSTVANAIVPMQVYVISPMAVGDDSASEMIDE